MRTQEEHLPQLLFIDDEEDFQKFISRNLAPSGFEILTTSRWEEARSLLHDHAIQPEIIFVEPWRDNRFGLDDLNCIRTEVDRTPVVVISIERDPKTIVEAIQNGVRDYIVKPFRLEKLEQTIQQILLSKTEMKEAAVRTRSKRETQTELIYSDPKMKKVYDTIVQIGSSTVPVLIQGESGVGKDVVARLIHEHSRLGRKSFVKVNCAALPAELTESELFGHTKGAFTGAHIDRPGKFEYADGGTIFLDEIGEFPPATQAKLLQVLQDGRFTRLGSNDEIEIDVRVIAATNKRLEAAIEEKQFRADLYYRLNVVNLDIPPLRDRKCEISLLCDFFVENLSRKFKVAPIEIPSSLMTCFQQYDWPGNVRELENLIKRYLVLQDAETIQTELENKTAKQVYNGIEDIAEDYLPGPGGSYDLKEVAKKAAARVERTMIEKALRRTNWNKWQAAKDLSVSYKTLLSRIEEYQIKP